MPASRPHSGFSPIQLSFLGRKVVGAADVTVAFLRWVLALLFESLRAVALRALALVS